MRDLSSGLSDHLVNTTPKRLVFLIEAEFRSGWLRLYTGPTDLDWGGRTWLRAKTAATGGGALLAIEPIVESGSIEANGLRATLSGCPTIIDGQSVLAQALDAVRNGKLARIYVGAITEAGALVDQPYAAFVGYVDSCTVEDAGETCTIILTAENEMIRLQRASNLLLDDNTQRKYYPTDTGMRYRAALAGWKGTWGGRQVGGTGSGTGGGGGGGRGDLGGGGDDGRVFTA